MLELIVHSRTEDLLEELALRIDGGLGPLSKRIVIVPSKGLGRWLAQELARHTGLAAGLHLPFASTWLWEQAGTLLPDTARPENPQTTMGLLSLMGLLAELERLAEQGEPGLDMFRRGHAEPVDGRRLALARRVADSLDSLQVYRPDWLLAWEAGTHADAPWQARLWQALASRSGLTENRARLLADLQQLLDTAESGSLSALPGRVSLFMPGALPASQRELFLGLGRHTNLDLYLLRPARPGALTEHAPVLAPWLADRLEAELDQPLIQAGVLQEPVEAQTRLPLAPGRLGRLQGALDGRPADTHSSVEPEDNDPSLQGHAAHSLWREVEVLHDELLRLFDSLETLHPDQILVLVADLPAWAPAIEAVFGRVPSGRERPALPFCLSRHESAPPEWPALLDHLLSLGASRFGAEEVLGLLRLPLLAEVFGLLSDDAPRLRELVGQSGVRWGLDGLQARTLGLPEGDGFHWHTALGRLLAGLAAPLPGGSVIEDPAGGPWPGLTPVVGSGESARRLRGALAGLLRRLARWQQALAEPRSVPEWCRLCAGWLTDMVESVEGERALGGRRLLHELGRLALAEGCDTEGPLLDAEAFRQLLLPQLETGSRAGQFLDGRITFGEMTTLGGVPSRVLCLLGLNNGDFPRQNSHDELDLAARDPRPGDRDPRREDRLLFRQAILCAREVLYLSWCGHEARRNTVREPSTLVHDLMEHLARSGDILPVFHHPLQPFHPGLFPAESEPDPRDPASPGLRPSYREDLALALARRAQGARGPSEGLYTGEPATPSGEDTDAGWEPGADGSTNAGGVVELPLVRLLSGWRNPAREWLRGRYRLQLDFREEQLPERESFEPGGLEQWALKQATWRPLLRGQDASRLRTRLMAEGLLPSGVLGGLQWDTLASGARAWREALAKRLPDWHGDTQECPVRLHAQGLLVTGTIDGLVTEVDHGGLRLDLQVGKLHARHQVQAWLVHLVYNAWRKQQGLPCRTSLLIGKESCWEFREPDSPLELLKPWLEPWSDTHRAEPVPFAPETSLAWAVAVAEERDPVKVAADTWQGDESGFSTPEGADPWLNRAWGNQGFTAHPGLQARFGYWAVRCLGPLLIHRVKGTS